MGTIRKCKRSDLQAIISEGGRVPALFWKGHDFFLKAFAQAALQGDPGKLKFPRPMTDRPGLDFSFSGLKTFTLNTAKAHDLNDAQAVADIAWAFQDAAVDTLVIKCRRALTQTGRDALVVAGGVGATQRLRQRLSEWSRKADVSVFYPRPEFCTDNAAMVAYTGWLRLQGGERQGQGFQVYPRWSLLDLPPVDLSLQGASRGA